MSSQNNNPWQKRIRRLFFFVGSASTIWFVSSYILERLKETRLRAIKERKQRDLMKNHFTSLISTISFTLYALLPTIQPQLFDEYNIEDISKALQDLSSSSNSNSIPGSGSGSNLSESTNSLIDPTLANTTPGNSLLLSENIPDTQHHHQDVQHPVRDSEVTQDTVEGYHHEESSPETSTSSVLSGNGLGTESWASEFQRRESHPPSNSDTETETETETESEGMLGSSIGQIDTEDAMSSIVSQSISLPPTDTSSPSPPSDLSRSEQLHPSPPRSEPVKHNKYHGRSKKELWKELKLQSLTRTITTIYLLPMLFLLTTSQLSILARSKYLKDIENSLEPPPSSSASPSSIREDEDDAGLRTPRNIDLSPSSSSEGPKKQKKRGWFSSFSIESMGLSEFSTSDTSYIPNPLSILPTSITSYLPSIIAPSSSATSGGLGQGAILRESQEILALRKQEEDEIRAEAERLFLTYSWWFLNSGWKSIGGRVEESVVKIFGSMPLKKELTIEDWESKLKEVRAEVEMELSENSTIELYDFTPNILPSTSSSNDLEIPYPKSPSDHSIYLKNLYEECEEQLNSPDSRYLIEKGISTLLGNLLQSLKNDLYFHNNNDDHNQSKRLVDCLPEFNKWGKDVWNGIPDSGVEALLGIPEFEGFSALIFGDWAPRSQD